MVENMNTYRIIFRNSDSAKTFTLTVDKITFEEAASAAYLERRKLGLEYKIVSIKDTGY
tara:strand:+ start:830 stop:1006 length:177 start_codon:yes stop_codon:yes gene_type:complete